MALWNTPGANGGGSGCWLLALLLGCVVLGHHVRGDPAAFAHSDALAAGPFPDLVRATAAAPAPPSAAPCCPTARTPLTSRSDVRREGFPHRGRVLLAQVDLVAGAVKGERHRLLGRALAVMQVAHNEHLNALRHSPSPVLWSF